MSQETTNFKTFNYQENGQIAFSILSTVKTTSILDAGLYNIATIWQQGDYKTNLSLLQMLKLMSLTYLTTLKKK